MFSFKMITPPPWPHVASIIHFLSAGNFPSCLPPIEREKKIGAVQLPHPHSHSFSVNLANVCHPSQRGILPFYLCLRPDIHCIKEAEGRLWKDAALPKFTFLNPGEEKNEQMLE